MIFPGWRIGLDIQTEGVRAVAVQKNRQGWQLRKWWHLPFPTLVSLDNVLAQPSVLIALLNDWRKQLPRRFRLSVSFPTERTFQQRVPVPDKNVSEAVCDNYVAYTTARQLQLSASQLCYDYVEMDDELNVTASHQSDLDLLLSRLAAVQLYPDAVTPGDKVLCTLPMECHPQSCRYRIHEESDYWLWASCHQSMASGWLNKQQFPDLTILCKWLNTRAEDIAFSSISPSTHHLLSIPELDVWQLLTRLYPPLPQINGYYTVALGLALAGASR